MSNVVEQFEEVITKEYDEWRLQEYTKMRERQEGYKKRIEADEEALRQLEVRMDIFVREGSTNEFYASRLREYGADAWTPYQKVLDKLVNKDKR